MQEKTLVQTTRLACRAHPRYWRPWALLALDGAEARGIPGIPGQGSCSRLSVCFALFFFFFLYVFI